MIRHRDDANRMIPPLPRPTAEMLAERRAVLRELAGTWSKDEADRIEAELHEMFDKPEPGSQPSDAP